MTVLINLTIGLAGALASLFLFFYAFSQNDTLPASNFLGFAALFLFVLFAWFTATELFGYYSKSSKGRG